MPEMTVTLTVTQGRRRFLERVRMFPRAFRWVPSLFTERAAGSKRWFWLQVRAAWLITGVQFQIDGTAFEIM